MSRRAARAVLGFDIADFEESGNIFESQLVFTATEDVIVVDIQSSLGD